MLRVNFIEAGKIRNIREEAGGFDYLVRAGSGCLKDCLDVFAALLRLSFDALRDIAGGGIYRNLSGTEDETIALNCLRVWTDCSGRIGCCDCLHSILSFVMQINYAVKVISHN